MEQITNQNDLLTNLLSQDANIDWGEESPRGGKSVLNRMLKDGAKVPLFFGQTLVNSLRDSGYNNTTSALCEHVDNSIEWGASEVRVYFHQPNPKSPISIVIYDNGAGMAPHVLKVASSFGGSLVFGSRRKIGRYGLGMKVAALSLCPAFDIYSWQEPRAYYGMSLDVRELSNSRANLIELPDPEFNEKLPAEITDVLVKRLAYPKDANESQTILASSHQELEQTLAESGTIIYMPACDRLTYQSVRKLVDHATSEMARVYRRFIDRGIRLYVNNRRLDPFDPTYSMTSARHTKIVELTPRSSRLLASEVIEVPISALPNAPKAKIQARLFILPYEQWTDLGRNTLKTKLHLFEDHSVSLMRNDREVAIGSFQKFKVPKHHDFNWIRLEIDFTGEVDEGFGIASNKQGVRPKQYVADAIVSVMGEHIKTAREMVRRFHAESATRKGPADAERRATDAEPFQGHALPGLTNAELESLDDNLRALAVVIKRDDESDEDAYQRLKRTDFATIFKHDPYWPFYHCDFKFGKVITTINTAHPFFTRVWQPLSQLATVVTTGAENSDDEEPINSQVSKIAADVLAGLQALLLSLARTQSQLSIHDRKDEFSKLFTTLQKEWSNNLENQLNVR